MNGPVAKPDDDPVIWRRAFMTFPRLYFGLNYDPSHFVLQHMDPALALKEFQDRIVHLHAKDVKIRQDRIHEVGVFAPLEWHQPRIPGYGEMDWGRFLGSVMETSYRGPVCIEVGTTRLEKRWRDGRMPCASQAMSRGRTYHPSEGVTDSALAADSQSGTSARAAPCPSCPG